MSQLDQRRFHFIDHLRGFMFLLMAIDHALHAYAFYWGPFWFFRDSDRSMVFDALYLQNQSILMPMLFFIFGMFVLPSLQRRGIWGYLKERSIRLGIPYIIGVPLIMPILTYPKYEHFTAPGISLFDFVTNIYFPDKVSGAGPFWVLYVMALYSFILILVVKILPWYFRWTVSALKWAVKNPIPGFLIFGFKSAVLLGISDLIWGAPWWIGFGKLFYFQASRFLLILLYFFAGAAVSASGIFNDQDFMKKFADRWLQWLIIAGVLGFCYAGYSLAYIHEGAYSEEIRYYFKTTDWNWDGAWAVIASDAPGVLIRTTLHGYFCLAQALALLAIFYRFVAKPTPFWTSLAVNCYGLFLLHDILVIWGQYYLVDMPLPILIKFLFIAMIGISLTWWFNDRVLLRNKYIKRVLSPDAPSIAKG